MRIRLLIGQRPAIMCESLQQRGENVGAGTFWLLYICATTVRHGEWPLTRGGMDIAAQQLAFTALYGHVADFLQYEGLHLTLQVIHGSAGSSG